MRRMTDLLQIQSLMILFVASSAGLSYYTEFVNINKIIEKSRLLQFLLLDHSNSMTN